MAACSTAATRASSVRGAHRPLRQLDGTQHTARGRSIHRPSTTRRSDRRSGPPDHPAATSPHTHRGRLSRPPNTTARCDAAEPPVSGCIRPVVSMKSTPAAPCPATSVLDSSRNHPEHGMWRNHADTQYARQSDWFDEHPPRPSPPAATQRRRSPRPQESQAVASPTPERASS